ncbi:hypothetical protein SAMN06295905_0089 [Devosia lucknowensis]|uniref:Uncharacterized protein n=1 Tax=Devosia lucknowensis TaxID=1096929 RepID=A0A1Y6E717_9HYPH|nr:hypothetical protein [Devosia lucknowensis]SMQ58498.1 hypothetical protein SAMN06295905_0089 [Devosia lucknowensis]
MVQHHDNSDPLMPYDATFDATEQISLGLPYSQDEIEDLLYGSDRPVEERIDRLKEMRAELATRESGDFGDQDPRDMIGEIDRAITELSADSEQANENGELDAAVDIDPADHLDALSPDDVDARQALIGEEEFYDEEEEGPADDDNAWHGSDEFKLDLH